VCTLPQAEESEKSEESEEEHEETEGEFLERYAKTARELQEEAVEEAENGQDEDGHEIELGVLGLVDQEDQVVAFLKAHGKNFITQQPPLPEDLITRFQEKFPDCKFYFCSS
jgi:TRAP-type C4-dicarboxylate transport system substrate-binding protein